MSSYQVDGSVDTALAWEDREVTVALAIDGGTEDMAAGLLQVLARSFRDECWLEFQAGTTHPVFFRTRPTTLEDVADFGPNNPGLRVVTLQLPAAPFARGLPVTGTALVPNDPTDGGMRFTVSDVKGDVPAPLNMALDFGTGSYDSRHMIASSNSPTFHHVAPVLNTLGTVDIALSTVTDSSAVGGTYGRATLSGANNGPWVDLTFSSILPGEYRLLVRARSSQAGTLGPYVPSLGDRVSSSGTVWRWLDLGVYRFPTYSPAASAWKPATTTTATWRGKWNRTATGAGTVDVDHAVLVPAPGADGSNGSVLFSSSGTSMSDLTLGYDMAKLTVDSEAEQAYYATTTGQAAAVASVSGAGFPRVTPSVPNVITLGRLSYGAVADNKAATTAVDWSYHPCYLTIRGD